VVPPGLCLSFAWVFKSGAWGAPFGAQGSAVLRAYKRASWCACWRRERTCRFYGRICGVVKARATSHQRLRVRIPPAAKAVVAQMVEQWQMLGPSVPAARVSGSAGRNCCAARGWNGEAQGYFLRTNGGEGNPQALRGCSFQRISEAITETARHGRRPLQDFAGMVENGVTSS
jgi:hypothetical protein